MTMLIENQIRFDTTDFAGPVLAWYTPKGSTLTRLPVVSLTCDRCGQIAPLGADNTRVARINGDSRYGYETYHLADVCPGQPDLGTCEADNCHRAGVKVEQRPCITGCDGIHVYCWTH